MPETRRGTRRERTKMARAELESSIQGNPDEYKSEKSNTSSEVSKYKCIEYIY